MSEINTWLYCAALRCIDVFTDLSYMLYDMFGANHTWSRFILQYTTRWFTQRSALHINNAVLHMWKREKKKARERKKKKKKKKKIVFWPDLNPARLSEAPPPYPLRHACKS
jgi:hypothetical protein